MTTAEEKLLLKTYRKRWADALRAMRAKNPAIARLVRRRMMLASDRLTADLLESAGPASRGGLWELVRDR